MALGAGILIFIGLYRQAKAAKAEKEASLAPENQRRLLNLDQHALGFR